MTTPTNKRLFKLANETMHGSMMKHTLTYIERPHRTYQEKGTRWMSPCMGISDEIDNATITIDEATILETNSEVSTRQELTVSREWCMHTC